MAVEGPPGEAPAMNWACLLVMALTPWATERNLNVVSRLSPAMNWACRLVMTLTPLATERKSWSLSFILNVFSRAACGPSSLVVLESGFVLQRHAYVPGIQ